MVQIVESSAFVLCYSSCKFKEIFAIFLLSKDSELSKLNTLFNYRYETLETQQNPTPRLKCATNSKQHVILINRILQNVIKWLTCFPGS